MSEINFAKPSLNILHGRGSMQKDEDKAAAALLK